MKPVIKPLEDLLSIDDLDQAIVNLAARVVAFGVPWVPADSKGTIAC